MHHLRSMLTICLLAVPLGLLGACSDEGSPSGPEDREPIISVIGVEDGGSYFDAVTIVISVDVGTYSAELDGAMFLSGQTVSAQGEHTLVVQARNGLATAERTLTFSIREPGLDATSLLIIRVLDLGANDAGGGGDAILISDSSAAGIEHALVDAGPGGVGGSNHALVAQRLQSLGVDTLTFAQLTHAHTDHFDGLDEVLRALDVSWFVYNGQARSLGSYNSLLTTAAAEADSVTALTSLRQVELGAGTERTTVTMVPPLTAYLQNPTASSDQLNNGSIGTAVERGGFRMFLTGDGEVEANTRWRTQFPALSGAVDVLKVGHHGANDAIFDVGISGSSSWLDHTDPEVALISANGTTHARVNALNRLLTRSNLRTYCTNVHGTISLRVDGQGNYVVSVERMAESDCVPGSQATT